MKAFNVYVKYAYIPLILAIVVLLVILLNKTAKLMKKTAGINDEITDIKKNVNSINDKVETIKETKESWQFFISLYIIIVVLKETIKDYRQTKLLDRKLSKSFKKTCKQNISKIRKIKI